MPSTVCLTFDFDALSVWLAYDRPTTSMLNRGEYGARVGVPRLLRFLAAQGIPATFFVPGHTAESFPEETESILVAGHEVGHHSWAHTPPETTSAMTLVAEARRTSKLLERLLGKRPHLYRPPHGKLSPGKLAGLWALRQTVVLWNRDPKDFAAGAVEPIRRWFESAPLAGGDIVLLHDVHAHIAPALETLIERARRLGLGFGTPSEWRHA